MSHSATRAVRAQESVDQLDQLIRFASDLEQDNCTLRDAAILLSSLKPHLEELRQRRAAMAQIAQIAQHLENAQVMIGQLAVQEPTHLTVIDGRARH